MLWPEGLLQPGSAFGCWYVFLVLFAVCPHCHHLSHPFEISCLKGGPLRQTFPQGLFLVPSAAGFAFFPGVPEGVPEGVPDCWDFLGHLGLGSVFGAALAAWQCHPGIRGWWGFESMHWWPSTSTVAKQKTVTVSCFSLVFSHGNFRFIRGSHKGK